MYPHTKDDPKLELRRTLLVSVAVNLLETNRELVKLGEAVEGIRTSVR